MEVVASLSQGRTAAAQCRLFTYKSVPVIFEPPCSFKSQNTSAGELLFKANFLVLPRSDNGFSNFTSIFFQ